MSIKVFIQDLETDTPVWMSEQFTTEKSVAIERAICERFQHVGGGGLIHDLIVLHSGDMHKGNWRGEVVEGRFCIDVDLGIDTYEFKVWTKKYYESKCQVFPGADDVLGSFLAKDDADVAAQLKEIGHNPDDYRWEVWK